MNQSLIAGEIDFRSHRRHRSRRLARADGHPEIRGRHAETRDPMEGGKGGISWIEITSQVNNPQLSPLASDFLEYVQSPKCHTRLPSLKAPSIRSLRWAIPKFKLFTKEELDAIQWDSLEEEMGRSAEYDIVPDYDKLLDIMTAAKREASGG